MDHSLNRYEFSDVPRKICHYSINVPILSFFVWSLGFTWHIYWLWYIYVIKSFDYYRWTHPEFYIFDIWIYIFFFNYASDKESFLFCNQKERYIHPVIRFDVSTRQISRWQPCCKHLLQFNRHFGLAWLPINKMKNTWKTFLKNMSYLVEVYPSLLLLGYHWPKWRGAKQ